MFSFSQAIGAFAGIVALGGALLLTGAATSQHFGVIDEGRGAYMMLPILAWMRYHLHMAKPAPFTNDDEDASEAQALAAAIAESDADPRTAPHEDVRAWLLRLANGEFDAPPPEPH